MDNRLVKTIPTILFSLFLASGFTAVYGHQEASTQTSSKTLEGKHVIEGTVVKGMPAGCSFRAKAGQRLSIRLETSTGTAAFSLLVGGASCDKAESYSDDSVNVSEWNDKLRKTGEYRILIEPKSEKATFKLTVAVD